ncbi:MAG: protein BatD [Anaerolineae bacterium]|nr:protein BatD [Anaerolineae bacterium]
MVNCELRITNYELRIANCELRIANYELRIAFRILRLIPLLCLLLMQTVPTLAQSDITFTASVDRTQASTDDMITLQLTLAGTFRSSGTPQLPALQGFAVVGTSQSSQFSMINGKTSSQMNFIYRLQPTQIGTLTIPAIPIQIGDQTYQTDPIAIEVTQGAAPQPQQPGSGDEPAAAATPSELSGQSFYVEAEVDNPAPFVGEQITYTFRLYQAANFSSRPTLNWPEFTGFLGYDLTPNKEYQQTVAGRQYLVTEVRRALFPTNAGEVTLAPSILSVPGDFFNRGFSLETNSVAVNVHALPDMPVDFQARSLNLAVVGQLELEAWVEPAESRVNEPVTLFVRARGTGNINAVPDPVDGSETSLPGWRVYEAQVSTNTSQQGDLIQGEKVFERLLVPTVEGTLTIPAFTLAYFDPADGAYHTAETLPITVAVARGAEEAPGPVMITNGKQEVVVLGSDIRHIKAAPSALTTARAPLLSRPLYWVGWAVPLWAVVGAWVWQQRQHTLTHNVAYARRQRARRLTRKRLATARKLLAQDENAVYAAVSQALTHYLGDKFNLSSAGLTRDTIRRTLAMQQIDEALTERLLTAFDWADSGRFAPVAAGRNAEALVDEAEALITTLEEQLA